MSEPPCTSNSPCECHLLLRSISKIYSLCYFSSQGLHGAIDEPEYGQTNHSEGTKQRELSAGLSMGNENSGDNAGRLSFSNAKARELAGDNIFGRSPSDPGKVAPHNREVNNETLH